MEPKLSSRMFDDPGELEPFLSAWDELAVDESQPFAAPAWAMAWWSHLRPRRAELRTVLVWQGDSLVGVVPLFTSGRRYLPLGEGLPATEPLARQSFERGVAEQAAMRLAEAEPAPTAIGLDLRNSSPSWAALLCESWPAGRRLRPWVTAEAPVPRIDLDAGFDAWVSSRSTKFRREMRQKQRAIEKAGGSFRYATSETLEDDVGAFLQLHRRRRSGQGGTSLTGDDVGRMLIAAGSALLESGRFRLLCLELEGKPIAARVLLATEREVCMWNSGFDEDFSKLSPSMQSLLHALGDAASGRDELGISLGPGGQSYKNRLSTGEDTLASYVLLPSGIGYPLARLRLAREQWRHALVERLSPTAKRRLRRLLRRSS
ncbi:MAG TPA: GNAT family N-acetyltransferase [Solirubrobacterales bacterium]|nr:GNAT family N-acetyltransferase [Solirubrobacterales bacterium]